MGHNFLKKNKIKPSRLIKLYQVFVQYLIGKPDPFATLSYSQEGEDLILKRIFEEKKNGFYVDVGAHHPMRFSNTYLFYKMGWKGINLDATPGSMDEFKKIRPNDINLEKAISNNKELLKYYIFNESALNTFSLEEANKKNGLKNFKIIEIIEIYTSKLSEVLKDYLGNEQHIDFLNIDVEGYDFKVLNSIDWTIHNPTIILIESLDSNLERIDENEIYQYLKLRSYRLFAKTFNTLIFRKDNE